jgi:hypothetical protein
VKRIAESASGVIHVMKKPAFETLPSMQRIFSIPGAMFGAASCLR